MKRFIFLLLSPVVAFGSFDSDWRIRATEWTSENEMEFSRFVQRIGESQCASTMACLKSPENPFRETDHPGWKVRTDCAKLPYLLRSYFAWKKGLPFSHVSQVASVGFSRDLRYSTGGNVPTRRREALGTSQLKVNGPKFISSLLLQVNTAMMRTPPRDPVSSAEVFSDFYSPEISADGIVPGMVLYDPAGHAALVYRVEPDGRILTLEAHPDDSVTRGVYGQRFPRSALRFGAGFKGWRPQVLEGAQLDPERGYIGGKIRMLRDAEIPRFSLEQFTSGNRFEVNGQALDFYYYVRSKMSRGTFRLDPISEMTSMMKGLCGDLKDRMRSIDAAIRAGLHLKPHPPRLPRNIFGADGEWEEYSTPGRDTRLRLTFKELRDQVALFLNLSSDRPTLQRDLRTIFEAENARCELGYQRSDGHFQALTIVGVLDRLFEIDFSPYQCSERRWGARETAEVRSCPADEEKLRWHQALQPLRNSLDRNPTVFHGYSLEEILSGPAQFGVKSKPNVDVRSLLYASALPSSAVPVSAPR